MTTETGAEREAEARRRAHELLVCEGASPECHVAHGRELRSICNDVTADLARLATEAEELRRQANFWHVAAIQATNERDAARAELAALRSRMEEAAREDDPLTAGIRRIGGEGVNYLLGLLDLARASNAELRGMLREARQLLLVTVEMWFGRATGTQERQLFADREKFLARPDVTAATDTGGTK